MKIQYRQLIQKDINTILENANFTEDQHRLFIELVAPSRSRCTDDALCMKLNISRSTFYRIKKEIDTKVSRILN